MILFNAKSLYTNSLTKAKQTYKFLKQSHLKAHLFAIQYLLYLLRWVIQGHHGPLVQELLKSGLSYLAHKFINQKHGNISKSRSAPLTFVSRLHEFTFWITSLQKPLSKFYLHFIFSLLGFRARKIIKMFLVHWPGWLPRPCMVKTL